MSASPVQVIAFPDRYTPGYPKHDEDDARGVLCDIGIVLAEQFDSDAHFVAYATDLECRLSVDLFAPEHADKIELANPRMTAAVFDVDDRLAHAADQPARPEWWEAEKSKLAALREEHPDPFVYRSRGGYRIVSALAEPHALRSRADADTWRGRYMSWCRYLRRRFDIVADRACADWTRFFRAPHVVRDGVRQARETIADPQRIGVWAPVLSDGDCIAPQPPKPLVTEHRTIDPESPEGIRAIESAKSFLAGAEPAIEGQGGSSRLFRVACRLMYSALPLDVLRRLVEEIYNPRCKPPWSTREIEHKLADADRIFDEPRGLPSPDFLDRMRGQNGTSSGDDASERINGEGAPPEPAPPPHDGGAANGRSSPHKPPPAAKAANDGDRHHGESNGATAPPDAPYQSPHLPSLQDLLAEALTRAERRLHRIERPIPMRWSVLDEHFGRGMQSGVHVVCSTTGIGKTALGLQQAVFAAQEGFPAAYIGLELRRDEAGMRLLGEHARVPWSRLYTGQATIRDIELSHEASLDLQAQRLPLHIIPRRAQGWPASKLGEVAEEMRKQYPEPNGPGSLPIFIGVDYLQILGPELVPCGDRCFFCNNRQPDKCEKPRPDSVDIRERIARATYTAHDVSERFDAVVFVVSSVAREKYNLWKPVEQASLTWQIENGRPIQRRILGPDCLVGLGQESGEIEYGADSVSALIRVPETWTETGCEVVFATAKGRATGATWSPLRFTGFGYVDSADGGMSVADALAPEDDDEKEQKKDQRKQRRQQQADTERSDRQAKADAQKKQQLQQLQDEVIRAVISSPCIGKVDLRNRVSAAVDGKQRQDIDVAIAACDAEGRIVVVRRNSRDHRHHPAGWNTDMCVCAQKKSPHTPPSVPPLRHTGGRDGDQTPATLGTPQSSAGDNRDSRVAEASATPATPPWEEPCPPPPPPPACRDSTPPLRRPPPFPSRLPLQLRRCRSTPPWSSGDGAQRLHHRARGRSGRRSFAGVRARDHRHRLDQRHAAQGAARPPIPRRADRQLPGTGGDGEQETLARLGSDGVSRRLPAPREHRTVARRRFRHRRRRHPAQ